MSQDNSEIFIGATRMLTVVFTDKLHINEISWEAGDSGRANSGVSFGSSYSNVLSIDYKIKSVYLLILLS